MVAAGSRGGGIVISCPCFSLPSSEMAGKGGLCVEVRGPGLRGPKAYFRPYTEPP